MLEVEMARRNIPFVKYGGLKFLESAHVKDALALLRILANPLDEVSWFRILQLLDGVGPAAAQRAMEDLGVRAGTSDDRAPAEGPLLRLIERPPAVPPSASVELGLLRRAFADCARGELGAGPELERLRAFLEPVFERRYESAASRLRDLDQLEAMAE